MTTLDHPQPESMWLHPTEAQATSARRAIEVRELSWPAMAAHVPAWQELGERALESNVFYEPAFALAAAPVFGGTVRVLTAWAADERRAMLGFLPLCTARWRYGLPLRVLVGWTHPYAPSGMPLVDADRAEQVLEAMFEHLRGEFLLLPLVRDAGAFAEALKIVIIRTGSIEARFGSHERAFLEPGDGRLDHLDRSMSAGKRKELRRQRRRLSEQGDLRHVTCDDPLSAGESVDAFLALEASGWKGRAGTAAALRPAIATFLRQAVTELTKRSQARIDRLMLDDRTLSATITLRAGTAAWFWKITHDEEFGRSSPGVQLACDLTRSLLADAGIQSVDSCATADHPMINRIWRERIALSDRLIAVGETRIPFSVVMVLEAARRQAIYGARSCRDGLRRLGQLKPFRAGAGE